MAEGDLCTVDEVKEETLKLVGSTTYDTIIQSRITKYSADLKYDIEQPDLTSENINAKNCIIFRVCAFLVSKGVLQEMSRETLMETEGDESRQYNIPMFGITITKPTTYMAWYWYYYARLKPRLPVGIVVAHPEEDTSDLTKKVYR